MILLIFLGGSVLRHLRRLHVLRLRFFRNLGRFKLFGAFYLEEGYALTLCLEALDPDKLICLYRCV